MFFWHLDWCLVTMASIHGMLSIAIKVHQLPFPVSLPYHLEVITCLLIQKLTKDRSVSTLLLDKILQ